jgi:hypothetical protein
LEDEEVEVVDYESDSADEVEKDIALKVKHVFIKAF